MADNFNLRSFLSENKLTKNAQLLKEGSDYGFDEVMDAIADDFTPGTHEFEQMEDAVQDAFYNGQVDTSDFSHDPSAPAREMRAIADSIGLGDEQANDIEQAQHDIERQYEQTVNENKMTQREKYLAKLVENALGITPHEENPDHEFGTNKVTGEPLPNPNDTMVVEDEMADETVIPEYRTIDELMKSIDHGTNEVAEKHKMDQMKKIAEALRMKAKKMEESEHAAHISPKDLKQLATDAAKLEKAAEKLKSAFDKKFNKKEKSAAAPKAEKVEALQEGTFDLRKFLTENKMTRNSRMLSEEEQTPELGEKGYKFANGMTIEHPVGTKFDTTAMNDSLNIPKGIWTIVSYHPNGQILVKCDHGELNGKKYDGTEAGWDMAKLQNFLKNGMKPAA